MNTQHYLSDLIINAPKRDTPINDAPMIELWNSITHTVTLDDQERLGGGYDLPTPAERVSAPKTHTITLEMQGVPADIARHRRSVDSKDQCAANVRIEHYDPDKGYRRMFVEPCLNKAISLSPTGLNRCTTHRRPD